MLKCCHFCFITFIEPNRWQTLSHFRFLHVPDRSSWNSSSSESSIRSSTKDVWRDSDCLVEQKWKYWKCWRKKMNLQNPLGGNIGNLLTALFLRRGGERLFQSASSWSKCWDCASAACSGPMVACDWSVFISAIFEISSMLADTEKRRFNRSSTCAIITDDVKWPYFFCHVYVSSDTSFFSKRRICRFGPAGRKSLKAKNEILSNEHKCCLLIKS